MHALSSHFLLQETFLGVGLIIYLLFYSLMIVLDILLKVNCIITISMKNV